MNVAGRSVLLTGATGGLGHAIARKLSGAGAQVILSGRRADVLEGLAQELGAQIAVADLSDPDSVRALVDSHADIDILVANAGLPGSGRLESFSEEEIDRALRVNLRAPIMMARTLVPRMMERGSGHIVFMSSLAGKTATAGSSIYNATKFGLRGFAGALRAELHGSGVGVSAIFPGFIRDAGMFADSGVTLPAGVGTKSPEHVASATLRAIERNKGEVDVAPVGLKVGTTFGSLLPETAATVTRRMGGDAIAQRFESGQKSKR
ncbi:MAG: SDR family NAD(P)-dependent oxidoreductase [Actinomycetota bacterium]|nr:SDR family NAD(P)-dependent oxidoreductase [Actinomycetota bacterium]